MDDENNKILLGYIGWMEFCYVVECVRKERIFLFLVKCIFVFWINIELILIIYVLVIFFLFFVLYGE